MDGGIPSLFHVLAHWRGASEFGRWAVHESEEPENEPNAIPVAAMGREALSVVCQTDCRQAGG